MKLIIRADDFGYTKTHNDGTIEAIENGIVTTVDLMLDTPGSIDAMERIKHYPWVSIGWHPHFWGRPILNTQEIPSMVNAEGRFKFRKDQKLKNTCDFDEIVKECRAQIKLCIKYLGKVPDTTWIRGDEVFERARKIVCDEYNIKYNFGDKPDVNGNITPADQQYQHLNIYMPNQPSTIYKICYDENYKTRRSYDPVKYFIEDQDKLMDKEIVITAWHPGYLDPYVMNESSMSECRVTDVKALCSNRLKQWIIDNKIELINHRDALFNTSEYQNHLSSIASCLHIKK